MVVSKIGARGMNLEADVKRAMVKSMKEHGGYGRRIEDQYGVGIYDLILIPFGLPVFMTEVKIIRGPTFAPTLRQHVELERIRYVGHPSGHVLPLLVGYKNATYYFSQLRTEVKPEDCFSVTTTDKSFYDQLVQFYNSVRK
jgi:hypothetical protein